MKKRILATLLSLCLVIGLLPVTAMAEDVTADYRWYSAEEKEFTLMDAADLLGFANIVNGTALPEGVTKTDFSGKKVTLAENIDLSGIAWTPIGNGTRSGSGYNGNTFKGTFDGGHNTITGLTITTGDADAAIGLFGVVDSGTVENLTLSNVNINASNNKNAGAAIGLMVNGATASSITVSGSISAFDGVGGVVGRMTISGTISNCVNNATVSATGSGAGAGGIVGKAYYTGVDKVMTISECANNGTVTSGYAAGGIVGLSAANVSGCTNTVAITAATEGGGIIGEQTMYGTVHGNTNSGTISNRTSGGTAYGGIIGWARYANSTADYPLCSIIVVSNNTNSGSISAPGANLGSGGIVGTIYNQATVTGNTNTADTIVGGIFASGIVGGAQHAEDNVSISGATISASNNVSTTALNVISANCVSTDMYNNDSDTFVSENNSDAWVAQIGTTKFATLQGAIAAAQAGDTVKLLKDVNLGTASLTINTGITLDGGEENYSITSSIGNAVIVVSTSEPVTIQNLKILATASSKTGRGIAINDNAAKLDVKNVEIEATQRGITVNTNANDGIVLNVEDSMISLVEPGKTAAEYDYSKTVLSTNDYNNSRGISLWEMANSKVTLKNTTVQGFYYSINNSSNDAATKSEGLVVSAEGCTFKGRAAVNQHVAETEYTLTNCDITGINNFGGGSEGFGCIVVYQGATGNSITVNGGSIACVSFNEIGAANPNANEYLIDDRAGNNTFTLNNMTYTCPREYGDSKGGIVKAIRPGSVITVNGGTYTMPELVDASYSDNGEVGQMNILGGNFTYNVVSVNVSDPDVENALNITGGTFSSDPTAYVANGYIAKRVGSAEPYTYTVMAKANLTDGVYMSDPSGATAPCYYSSDNGDGTWTVFYVAPYVAPTYSITVDSAKHGDVTVSPRNASKGDKVTITVESDKGYTLETLTVTDKDGDEIELTNKGDGKYTFTMPAGKVYVEATFMEDNSMLNFFVDVFPGDYYYDAVLWAAKNGITGGVDAAHFAPNATCTRAQVVTFLWRAAGSPAPKSSMMPFTDVPAGSYYETAVLWAAENGITGGTGNNAFSPDAACTRGQIVSFLWRALGFPTVSGSANPFADVAADAYYNTAVLWAAENGITGGTGNNAFSPDADCTRAQIVTFLYRSET